MAQKKTGEQMNLLACPSACFALNYLRLNFSVRYIEVSVVKCPHLAPRDEELTNLGGTPRGTPTGVPPKF